MPAETIPPPNNSRKLAIAFWDDKILNWQRNRFRSLRQSGKISEGLSRQEIIVRGFLRRAALCPEIREESPVPSRVEPGILAPRLGYPQREPLAVIGIGCRFPAASIRRSRYGTPCCAGIDAIRDVPEDRWKHARFHDTNPEKSGCIRNAHGGFIDGVDQVRRRVLRVFSHRGSAD